MNYIYMAVGFITKCFVEVTQIICSFLYVFVSTSARMISFAHSCDFMASTGHIGSPFSAFWGPISLQRRFEGEKG